MKEVHVLVKKELAVIVASKFPTRKKQLRKELENALKREDGILSHRRRPREQTTTA
jgi:hypothetical protein